MPSALATQSLSRQQWERTCLLVEQALQLSAADREEFLSRQCRNDVDVAEAARDLLQRALAFSATSIDASLSARLQLSQPSNPSFWGPPHGSEKPAATSSSGDSAFHGGQPLHNGDPRQVDTFRLISRIAAGGMGVVYLAMQEQPRRLVALKVMKYRAEGCAALRRFEHESHILGRLRHPNIAQVHEAGTLGDGSGGVHWFAMEYIEGARSLVRDAEARRLDTKTRLALFARVCDAVHHAHQRGIIHRDLKPANILVDSAGEPKVIDFGVARAVGADHTLASMDTAPGQLMGTVQYMSPEQCGSDPEDVDVRSDVYSLGLVLYELLCGARPYDLTASPVHLALRMIVERSPDPPSRHMPALRGDVETIVLKALEKEPARRYQSAAEFADDIRRSLRSEPILARPTSTLYQLRMLVRRHRKFFAALAALLLVLVGGFAATTAAMLSARQARNENAILAQRTFEVLRDQIAFTIRLAEAAGDRTLARGLIESFEGAVKGPFDSRPDLRALLHSEIGRAYCYISDPITGLVHLEQARGLARQSFGESHPSTMLINVWTAGAYREATHHEHAARVFEAAIDVARRSVADGDRLRALWSEYADMLHDLGRLDQAAVLYEELIASIERAAGDDSGDLAHFLPLLARVYRDQTKHAESKELLLRALELGERRLSPGDIQVHLIEVELGYAALAAGSIDEAQQWSDAALLGLRGVLQDGEDDARPLLALDLAAQIGMAEGHFEEAQGIFSDAAARAEQFLRGEQNWWAAYHRARQGECLLRLGRLAEAEQVLAPACELLVERLGMAHHRTQRCIRTMIALCEATGREDEAVAWKSRLRPAEVGVRKE